MSVATSWGISCFIAASGDITNPSGSIVHFEIFGRSALRLPVAHPSCTTRRDRRVDVLTRALYPNWPWFHDDVFSCTTSCVLTSMAKSMSQWCNLFNTSSGAGARGGRPTLKFRTFVTLAAFAFGRSEAELVKRAMAFCAAVASPCARRSPMASDAVMDFRPLECCQAEWLRHEIC